MLFTLDDGDGDGDEVEGELRAWKRTPGGWVASVQWRRGRVERFLKAEAAVSYSRAKRARNLLSQLFSFALRHDALPRNPLEGTSPRAMPKTQVRALSLEQVQAIRVPRPSGGASPAGRARSRTTRSATSSRS